MAGTSGPIRARIPSCALPVLRAGAGTPEVRVAAALRVRRTARPDLERPSGFRSGREAARAPRAVVATPCPTG
ncbi:MULTISPECIES: hypothetical protein [unclassified Methanoculleus]|uniref:hypothetical protein n=1 Tax=unclassified Methanoculleus TaxID=2619537 RepID=UPI00319DC520